MKSEKQSTVLQPIYKADFHLYFSAHFLVYFPSIIVFMFHMRKLKHIKARNWCVPVMLSI